MNKSVKNHFIMLIQWGLFSLFIICSFLKPSKFKSILIPYGYILIIFGFILIMESNIAHSTINKGIKLKSKPEPNPNAKLVQKGIYKYIRHPIYLGFICISFGLSFCIGNILSIIIALISLIFYYLKSIYEDKLLISTYNEYLDYSENVGRFLPRLKTIVKS